MVIFVYGLMKHHTFICWMEVVYGLIKHHTLICWVGVQEHDSEFLPPLSPVHEPINVQLGRLLVRLEQMFEDPYLLGPVSHQSLLV